jgi:hypothetical protein
VVEHPTVVVGTASEYAYWESRLREYLAAGGRDPANLERVDARLNYKENRITLYRLADSTVELSVADTLAHEFLHALLYQMGEEWAARMIDLVGKPVGNPARVGGI